MGTGELWSRAMTVGELRSLIIIAAGELLPAPEEWLPLGGTPTLCGLDGLNDLRDPALPNWRERRRAVSSGPLAAEWGCR